MYGPPPGFYGGGRKGQEMRDKLREPRPKRLRDVPHYVWRVCTTFLYRMFYIFTLVWEAQPFILFSLLFVSLFNGVVPVVTAYIGARVLNALAGAFQGGITFEQVLGLIVLQFTVSFVSALVNNLNSVVTRISSEIVTNHIKVKIMRKSKEIDLASFDMPDFYEKLENANREASMRPMQVISSTLSIASSVISLVGFIVVLAAVSPAAPWIVMAVSIPSAIISFLYRSKNFKYLKQHSKERRKMNYYSEQVTNKDIVKEMRIFNLSDLFIERYQEVFREYFAGIKRLILNENIWLIVLVLLRSAINCGFFLYIAKMVCDQRFQVGDFSLYTGALTSISSAAGTIISTTASIFEGTLFIDNMIAFMKHERKIVPSLPEPRKVERGGHTITFEDVSFRYPGSDHDVLHHLNFTLDPGDTCVLVGLNGAGKTTLIKLITRLYDPTEGRILFDGHDIREYDVEQLYGVFGIIFQDFGKYAVSVRENIRFGQMDKEDTDENIRFAAQQSSADAFIDALPDGYQTPLMRYFEDNGTELSIGQWQKLSIARAFYSDSDIIILDEPTASLDALAEQEIYNQVDSLRKDKTTVFVSHRLSSATVANKIIVLENGSIAEMGDHATLMRNHGHYYKLFSTQASRYLSEDAEVNSMMLREKKENENHGGEMPPMPHGGMPPEHPEMPCTEEVTR